VIFVIPLLLCCCLLQLAYYCRLHVHNAGLAHGVTKRNRTFWQPQGQAMLGNLAMFPKSLPWLEAGMLSTKLPNDQKVELLAWNANSSG